MPHALEGPRSRPSAGDVLDLIAGAVAAWMPFLLLSMPAIVLFVLFPLMLAAIPAIVVALLAGPPYLVVRMARRRGRRGR